jgi:hypothetical protein
MALKQIIAVILGACFVIMAALQYSRPDAVFWILVYLSGAVLSFLAALERVNRLLMLLTALAYTAGVYYFWSSMPTEEIAMLIFGAFSMLLLALLFKKRESLHPPHVPGHIKKWAN